jgi:hypothetical protein
MFPTLPLSGGQFNPTAPNVGLPGDSAIDARNRARVTRVFALSKGSSGGMRTTRENALLPFYATPLDGTRPNDGQG